MKEFFKAILSMFSKYSEIETKTKIQQLENTIKQKDNMIDALEANKEMLEKSILDKDIVISNLEADIKTLTPSGNIGLALTEDGSTSLKWVSNDLKLSNNFQVFEFMQNDGMEYLKLDMKIVEILQKIRDYYKKPVNINSGYRSPAYNEKIGGSTKSQHMLGKAVDFTVKGVPVSTVQKYIKQNWKELGVRGLETSAKTWVHIDIRDRDNLLEF